MFTTFAAGCAVLAVAAFLVPLPGGQAVAGTRFEK
jgi:hypothetical protein